MSPLQEALFSTPNRLPSGSPSYGLQSLNPEMLSALTMILEPGLLSRMSDSDLQS